MGVLKFSKLEIILIKLASKVREILLFCKKSIGKLCYNKKGDKNPICQININIKVKKRVLITKIMPFDFFVVSSF